MKKSEFLRNSKVNFGTFKATTRAWNVHEGKVFLTTLYQILLVIFQCSVSTCSMLGGTPLTIRMQNIYIMTTLRIVSEMGILKAKEG